MPSTFERRLIYLPNSLRGYCSRWSSSTGLADASEGRGVGAGVLVYLGVVRGRGAAAEALDSTIIRAASTQTGQYE